MYLSSTELLSVGEKKKKSRTILKFCHFLSLCHTHKNTGAHAIKIRAGEGRGQPATDRHTDKDVRSFDH